MRSVATFISRSSPIISDSQIADESIRSVAAALAEDLGSGDITASFVSDSIKAESRVIAREPAVLCGIRWFDEVFRQIDEGVATNWFDRDGDRIDAGRTVCIVKGRAKSLLSGERTALNFLQTLSGTATATRKFADVIAPYGTRILDTRKTIPGLRIAQKYAVTVGGGANHRIGLYDGVIVKENHHLLIQSLPEVLHRFSNENPENFLIEIEIEDLNELQSALDSGANRIMLDNFSIENMAKAAAITNRQVELEASGNITLENVEEVAKTGVDFISIGAITKHLRAIDFTMLMDSVETQAL